MPDAPNELDLRHCPGRVMTEPTDDPGVVDVVVYGDDGEVHRFPGIRLPARLLLPDLTSALLVRPYSIEGEAMKPEEDDVHGLHVCDRKSGREITTTFRAYPGDKRCDLFVRSLACRAVRAAEHANELKEREVVALEKLASCVDSENGYFNTYGGPPE